MGRKKVKLKNGIPIFNFKEFIFPFVEYIIVKSTVIATPALLKGTPKYFVKAYF